MKRRVYLSVDAARQFQALRSIERGLLRDSMRQQLVESDAIQETRNRFRLRRPSEFADFELRIQDWRVFYRVVGEEVRVVLIGQKRGHELIIEGRRFVL